MCPWTGRYEDTFFCLKSKFISKLLLYYLKSLFRDTEWTFGDTERTFRVTERTFGCHRTEIIYAHKHTILCHSIRYNIKHYINYKI